MDAGYPLSIAERWFGCPSNILSNEGLYNEQWLQVDNGTLFTHTYPPDALLATSTVSSGLEDTQYTRLVTLLVVIPTAILAMCE